MKDIDTSRYTITESGNVLRSVCRGRRMTALEEIKQKAEEWVNKEPEDKCREKYSISKGLLGLWEQTICEIRSEIKAQEAPALIYAKELCDKLEHSMCALAGGPYNLKYSIEEV